MNNLGELEARLVAEGFSGLVETDAAARVIYGTDNSVYQLRPAGAVVPTSAEDLATIVRSNNELGAPFQLVARGGGTGTNGQSLTNGLVVDTRRAMNKIVSVDVDAQEAVVQPGVVLGQLNALLARDGLFFAPHVSTATRATIGGMVSTDAAGKGSLVYGRTNRHVLGLDGVLADGTPWTFGALSSREVDVLSARPDRIGELHRLVADATSALPDDAFPAIPRGFTGYNLADAATSTGLDLTKLLCGSEGTLAMFTEIRIRLSPVPNDPHLAVIAYPTFDAAIRESNRLKSTRPIAIECLDERTISLAASSPGWPRLAALLGHDDRVGTAATGALLLIEFDGGDGIDELRDILPNAAEATALATTSDPDDIAAVWKVRSDAVGLLGQAIDGRRSVAFVEDCAVPPHHLETFVAGYRDVLDRHGLSYGMFGHADVGCIHVRPALDLYDVEHEALLRTISDEVAALVAKFGGVLWGEHGRGFRGEYLDLDDDIVRRMRLVKTAFDPRNLLNPGKLYSPLRRDSVGENGSDVNDVIRIDDVPLRVHSDRGVDEAERLQFDSAFSCNGNGICHHWGDAETMCPSYKVTLDPRLSPKGRADLLRAWLASPDDAELADDVADSMRQCLSCGACTGRCPVNVDIPELKSRFLERHPEPNRRRSRRDAVLSRFEAVLPHVQRISRVVSPVQRLSSPLVRWALGVVDLPSVTGRSLRRHLAERSVQTVDADSVGDATVVILPDAFTAYIDPDVLDATLDVLVAVGERPGVAPFVPSGKYDHVKGRRRRFAAATARRRSLIEGLAAHDIDVIVIEPAVSLLGDHEYVAIDPTFPHDRVRALADYLEPRLDRLTAVHQNRRELVQLFGHCTEVSIAPGRMDNYRRMLEVVGFDVTTESTTCCGMAGIFGHEAENQTMSKALFDRSWRSRLDDPRPDHRCVSGYSCRSQARRFGYPDVVHPIQLVAAALRP